MKIKRLIAALRSLLAPGIVWTPSTVPDNSGLFGVFGALANLNSYSEERTALATSGTNITLTPVQLLGGLIILSTGASGGFTITLPSTVSIIAALGPTIPTNNTFTMPITIVNFNIGQTGTVTVGDASTTLNANGGAVTIATNTTRRFFLTVATASTLTMDNAGTTAN
jgi:hypothetical protein